MISAKDPQFYAYLVSNLPQEFSERLKAVFLYADQRKAMKGLLAGLPAFNCIVYNKACQEMDVIEYSETCIEQPCVGSKKVAS